MCGIYGMIFHGKDPLTAKWTNRAHTFFNALAVTAADRGVDATGLARINRDGTAVVYKDIVASYQMVRREKWLAELQAIRDNSVFALMGHTRRKSHGENVRANAHPFEFPCAEGTFVGTHNGVIQNHEQFAPKEKLAVDSANLFSSLAAAPFADWPTVLERAEGNFALAMARGGEFYLARNSGSPCFVAYVPQFKATVYASTAHMLGCAMAMSGVTLTDGRAMKECRINQFTQTRRKARGYPFVEAKPAATQQAQSQYHTGSEGERPKLLPSAGGTSGSPLPPTVDPILHSTNVRQKFGCCVQCFTPMELDQLGLTPSGRKRCTTCTDRMAILATHRQRKAEERMAALTGAASTPTGVSTKAVTAVIAEVPVIVTHQQLVVGAGVAERDGCMDSYDTWMNH
jgi:predicted glutamine amidotransferase